MGQSLKDRLKDFIMAPEDRKKLRDAIRSRADLKKKLKKGKTADERAEIILKHRKK